MGNPNRGTIDKMSIRQNQTESPGILAYLGPEGTYSEEAALLYAPAKQKLPCRSLQETLMHVVSGEAEEAIVPIENSVIGTVIDSLDFLITNDNVFINSEVLLVIESALIARRSTALEEITEVRSKAEAFGQCIKFMNTHLPNTNMKSYSSTAAAVASLADEDKSGVAAIGPRRAAEINGMHVIKNAVQDKKNNLTRFVVVSKNKEVLPTGHDKTSLVFGLIRDRPGQLLRILKIFSERGINLTKIESRPTGARLGSYHFVIDCEGHARDPKLEAVFKELDSFEDAVAVKYLGSYPRQDEPPQINSSS